MFNWLINLFRKKNDIVETAEVEIEESVCDTDETVKIEEEEVIEENIEKETTRKFALLVGINRYSDSRANLRGCVNDVTMMKSTLIDVFKFHPSNIKVLLDSNATQKNIIYELTSLVNNAKSGDVLVFHFSGHGSQVRDLNGDEPDGHDECLCTFELDWRDPLIDDKISSILSKLPKDVSFTMVCDSCHSGSMTRNINNLARTITPPDEFLPIDMGKAFTKTKLKLDNHNRDRALLSGCRDDQTSADARINGQWNGALTYCLLESIKNNPDRSLKEIHRETVKNIKRRRYSQDPQLSGDVNIINNKIFEC